MDEKQELDELEQRLDELTVKAKKLDSRLEMIKTDLAGIEYETNND